MNTLLDQTKVESIAPDLEAQKLYIFHPDTLAIPSIATGLSILVLLCQALVSAFRRSKARLRRAENIPHEDPVEITNHKTSVRTLVDANGETTILTFRVARHVACLCLLSLTLSTAVSTRHSVSRCHSGFQVGLCITYGYMSLLSIASLLPTSWRRASNIHLSVLLLFAWSTFMYRDVWPLATYTLTPRDIHEGWLIWLKIGILSLAAVVIPLVVPRRYIPVDPQNPMPVTNPEQTTPLISFLLYFFVDNIIFKALQMPHLSIDDLPPLPDRDQTTNLMKASSQYLDPLKSKEKRHVFWSLLRVFGKVHVFMTILLVARVFTSFAAPYGMKRLLNYLEDRDRETFVRPWVWIVWLLVGPLLAGVAMQWYYFLSARTRVRYQALLTQLIFNHTLRMRVKADIAFEKTSTGSGAAESDEVESVTKSSNSLGKLLNLVTGDMENLERGQHFLFVVLYCPLQIALSIYFLFTTLGVSVIPGAILMALLIPVPGYLMKRMHTVQVDKMRKTDARIQSSTDAISVIRMIKLFGWEQKMTEQIDRKREVELKAVKEFKVLRVINGTMSYFLRYASMVLTFVIHTVILKREFTASRVFSSLLVFELLGEHLDMFFRAVPAMITDRIYEFLQKTELLDVFASDHPQHGVDSASDIVIRASRFTWTSDTERSNTFSLNVQDEILFRRGDFHLITGPTGCGKTSLLMALLGEMHYIPLREDSTVQLPRTGDVAYHAQEPWIFNDTIRNNILFNEPYDQDRYMKVVEQCALQEDFEQFDAGDASEVGEKGISLSGGQKARLSLARAIYSHAGILLLDDVLAALDVRTTRWIIEKCFRGELLKDRTVILATHRIAMVRHAANSILTMGLDGRSIKQSDLQADASNFSTEFEAQETQDNQIDIPDRKGVSGQLIPTEEVAFGHVGVSAFLLFFANIGQTVASVFFFTLSMLCLESFGQFSGVMETWSLGNWSKQYDLQPPSEIPIIHYLSIYLLFSLGSITMTTTAFIVFILGSVRSSRRIHEILLKSVLGTTWRWLDETPAARIIVRFTQDIETVDGPLASYFFQLFDCSMQMIFRFTAILMVTPSFALLGVIIAALGLAAGQAFMKAQLPIKRETSLARAAVVGHLATSLSGLVTIRAYGVQERYGLELHGVIDQYSRAARTTSNLNQWISTRIDMLGALFVASLSVYLVYRDSADASISGFSLTLAVSTCGLLFWWVRVVNEVELNSNSLERIQQFTRIDQEPVHANFIPPAYWPSSGALVVENLSARYSTDGPLVLQGISFRIEPGERIGLVGRTGSGKSSLVLSLLRCIPTEGEVLFDGIATDSIPPNALRSKVTVIPQVPELLHGTLRQNLDPFFQYSDAELNDVLRASGLFSLQSEAVEAPRITLDTLMSGGGSNISVGQRQIIALARAMLRRSKLVILDEATSAIDNKTDSTIQASLRENLGTDVSIITVAHRLHTVMDVDRIIVLSAGRLIECGRPEDLLTDANSAFYAMVNEDGDRDWLIELVKTRTKPSQPGGSE
ncbi:unnamed protein product [Somion occarium]|uniref:P-loop containing nucleoside triphosphate hydrolase protein n=1 Tax=Somion occarium TaxID=3059160 RepID=A0ABP1E9D1_9APHY